MGRNWKIRPDQALKSRVSIIHFPIRCKKTVVDNVENGGAKSSKKVV